VRKNRERGQINPFKLGKIFQSELKRGLTQIQIAKKYGYSVNDEKKACSYVCEIIGIASHEKEIREKLQIFDTSKFPSIYKAIKVLRELKLQEKGEREQKC